MSSARLILVPTTVERELLRQQLPQYDLQLCGFGLLSSGIITSRLLHQFRPQHVYLVGIAGAYQRRPPTTIATLAIGRAYLFRRVQLWGIGIGEGRDHQTAERLGWQLPDSLQSPLTLDVPNDLASDLIAEELLSVASASSDPIHSEMKQAQFPAADAEDMEGFAVAMACALNAVPLTVIRGISNLVGDRQVKQWCWQPALTATAELLEQVITATEESAL